MPLSLPILDETTSGMRHNAGAFDFAQTTLSLRELIRQRVQQEVERFNQGQTQVFRGLIEPEESERLLNGVRTRPKLDWERQFARAVTAYQSNGFLVLVDDRQATHLDAILELA